MTSQKLHMGAEAYMQEQLQLERLRRTISGCAAFAIIATIFSVTDWVPNSQALFVPVQFLTIPLAMLNSLRFSLTWRVIKWDARPETVMPLISAIDLVVPLLWCALYSEIIFANGLHGLLGIFSGMMMVGFAVGGVSLAAKPRLAIYSEVLTLGPMIGGFIFREIQTPSQLSVLSIGGSVGLLLYLMSHTIVVYRQLLKAISSTYALAESERRANESVARLNTIFENLTFGIVEADMNFSMKNTNRAFQEMLGYTEEELSKLSALEVTHPEDLNSTLERFEHYPESISEVHSFTKRLITKTGKIRWAKFSSKILETTGDMRLLSTVEDVTSSHEQQMALNRLNKILEIAPDLVGVIDVKSGKIIYENRAMRERLGLSESDSSDWSRLHHPEQVEYLLNHAIPTALKEGYWQGESILIDKNGKEFPISQVIISSKNEEGEVESLSSIMRDLSENVKMVKEIEQQRAAALQASRLVALGEMAGGIAHEINNPLTIIVGQADVLKQKLAYIDDPEVTAMLISVGKIRETSIRISKIIRGLRQISRDAEFDPLETVNLWGIIENTLSFCSKRFKANGVDLRVLPFEESLEINCRPAQIGQVLLNLLNNSFDAIVGKTAPWIEVEIKTCEQGCEILVTDSGQGIPPEIQDKILEPFFTTKEAGRGTGLGLSVSNGIVRSHGGTLQLNPAHAHTQFVVRLPGKKQMDRNSLPDLGAEL